MFFGRSGKKEPSSPPSTAQEFDVEDFTVPEYTADTNPADIVFRDAHAESHSRTPSFPKLPVVRERIYTILAADDEKDALILLQAMLADATYNIITATDGVKAIQLYEEHKPDMIILDVQMPGKNGFEVCKHIKSQHNRPYTPVFLVTAMDDPYQRVEGLKQGADDYITKPYFTEELQIKVASFLRIKEITEELARARDELAESEKRLTMKLYDLGKL